MHRHRCVRGWPVQIGDFLPPRRPLADLARVLTDVRNRVAACVVNVGAVLSDTAHILRHVHELKETLMADFSALNAKLDENAQAITEAVARVDADVQALRDEVARLQLDSDDQAQVDAAVAKVQASIDTLKAVDPVRDVEEPADIEPTEPTEPTV